jgi:hypothetical protein
MAFLIEAVSSLFGGGSQSAQTAQAAQQAMMLKSGDVSVAIDPDNKQIIFYVEEDKKTAPIIIDLKNGLILNASFPVEPLPTEVAP